nr:MAG TPA: hypothetical protein [Caudoviricetes sp.]
MGIFPTISILLIVFVISLLYMVIRMVYKDYINGAPLYIVTDKRDMTIIEPNSQLRKSNPERVVYLVELNGDFFVNATEESYKNIQLGDQVEITSSGVDRDFIIKKL